MQPLRLGVLMLACALVLCPAVLAQSPALCTGRNSMGASVNITGNTCINCRQACANLPACQAFSFAGAASVSPSSSTACPSAYNMGADYPYNRFTWSNLGNQDNNAQFDIVPGQSRDGVRGTTFAECAQLCLNLGACKYVSYFPVWFSGPSACFAKTSGLVPRAGTNFSLVPVATSDQGSFFGQKI